MEKVGTVEELEEVGEEVSKSMRKFEKCIGTSRKMYPVSLGFIISWVPRIIRLEMRQWKKIRIEEILVSNSSLVSGLSEAFGGAIGGASRCQSCC